MRCTENENAPAAGPRGYSHGSDEGSANTPTTHKMTEENAMTTVENPNSFRDLLATFNPAAADLPNFMVAELEACVRCQVATTDNFRNMVLGLLDVALEERDMADLTANVPVPVWATRSPDGFNRYPDGVVRRFHDISTVDVPGTGFGSGSVGVVTTGIETVGQPDEFTILVQSDGGEYLTATEARALAAALLGAANEADALDLSL